jgi:hypothetical protein
LRKWVRESIARGSDFVTDGPAVSSCGSGGLPDETSRAGDFECPSQRPPSINMQYGGGRLPMKAMLGCSVFMNECQMSERLPAYSNHRGPAATQAFKSQGGNGGNVRIAIHFRGSGAGRVVAKNRRLGGEYPVTGTPTETAGTKFVCIRDSGDSSFHFGMVAGIRDVLKRGDAMSNHCCDHTLPPDCTLTRGWARLEPVRSCVSGGQRGSHSFRFAHHFHASSSGWCLEAAVAAEFTLMESERAGILGGVMSLRSR